MKYLLQISKILLRKILREELDSHEKNISDLINSNLQTTIERIDKISTKMTELTASSDFTQKNIDKKIENAQQKIVNLEKNIN